MDLSLRSIEKVGTLIENNIWSAESFKKHITSISCTPEPVIFM